jgi:hypothetical protein
MLHDMWHNITQHHVTCNPEMLTCFLSAPCTPGGSWGEVYATPVASPHQSRNLLLSVTRFLTASVTSMGRFVCHSISSAFVTAEWRLYLCFCLSGTERKCTNYRYSLQAISNHLPFWGPNCRPTGAHTLQDTWLSPDRSSFDSHHGQEIFLY